MIDGKGRPGIAGVASRIGTTLAGWGLTPDMITVAGVVLALPGAYLVATGHFLAAFFVCGFAALLDVVDGAVAKARGGGSSRGAVLDATCDRISDTIYLSSLAWYLGAKDFRYAVLAMTVLGASFLVSYIRTKAAEYGFDAHVGLMERAERTLLLGLGLLLEAAGLHIFVPLLWIMLALTLFTAGQRFVAVWRQGAVEPPISPEELRLRVLPEWRQLKAEMQNREDDESMSIALKRAYESHRTEQHERRTQVQARVERAREERRRARAEVMGKSGARRTARTVRGGRDDRNRRPQSF